MGDIPVTFRNAVLNELVSLKPTVKPISVTDGAGLGEQYLGAFDATVGVISMRRNAESLLENPAEIPRDEINKLKLAR